MKKLLFILLFIPLILFSQEIVLNSFENLTYKRAYKSYYYKGNLFTGVVKTYYTDGQLRAVSSYKFGKEDGLFKIYYGNGILNIEKRYTYGKLRGLYSIYRDNGSILMSTYYIDDKPNGVQTVYYENGNVEHKANLKNPKRFVMNYNGLYEGYYENGQLSSKLNFKDNKKVGLEENYYEDGEIKSNFFWKNGVNILIGDTNIEEVNVYDLEPMIKLFLKDCKINNIKLSSDYKITSTFETLDKGIVALSYGIFNDKEIIIKVSPQEWSKASNPKRWYILYHELGHDVLNLKHGQGGKMMFNFTEEDYTWKNFFKDKYYMFNSMKSK